MRISRYLLFSLTLWLALLCHPQTAWATFTVVIDPGHGGKDPGTQHREGKLDEKAIALNVALKLGKMIEKNYRDVKIVYTRKDDTFPSLSKRTEIAKKAKGDLYISIHVNACGTSSINGIETYVFGTDGSGSGKERTQARMVEERENLDFLTGRQINFETDIDIETKILCQAQREKHNKQSLEVANFVQKSMVSSVKSSSYGSKTKSRGVIAKNLFVLCFVPMPAILIEMGYITNKAEEKYLNSDEGQAAFAKGIYNGFCQYKKNWDKRQLNPNDSHVAVSEDVIVDTPSNETSNVGAVKSEPEKKTDKTNQSSISQVEGTGSIAYRIQFISSDKLVSIKDKTLKGLNPVSYYKEGKLYKYTYGVGKSSKELNEELKKVKKLFPEAFVIKFDANGNRIH